MTRRYDPSPLQLELFQLAPVDFTKLASVPLKTFERSLQCPPPTRHTSDQYRCTYCDIAWDVDEDRPPCDVTPYPQEQGT